MSKTFIIVRECARKACRRSPALYFNSSTTQWYCQPCAFKINDAAGRNICEKK